MPCLGDPAESCGGMEDRIIVYEDTAWTGDPEDPDPPSPGSAYVPAVGTYEAAGCGYDSASARVLVADTYQDAAMTVQKCVEFAYEGGFRYAGVEWGTECFVGNTLHNLNQAPNEDCGQRCGGNPAQWCGNVNRVLVYTDMAWTDPTRAELIALMVQYNATLSDVADAITEYERQLTALQAFHEGGLPPGGGAETQQMQLFSSTYSQANLEGFGQILSMSSCHPCYRSSTSLLWKKKFVDRHGRRYKLRGDTGF